MLMTLLSRTNSSSCSRRDCGTCTWSFARRFSLRSMLALAMCGCGTTKFAYTPEQEPQYRQDAFACEQYAATQVNLGDRNQMWDSCMYSKGWRK